MEVKPIVPLTKGTRLIWPENGIQITAGIGSSGSVSFAMSILERYLSRGEYELDPAFLVFAQWAGEQEKEAQRETGELKSQLMMFMRLVHETRRERRLPSVYVQLLKRLDQTVFICERQRVSLPGELLTFCKELIRKKNQAEAYLQKPETVSRLWNLLNENGRTSAEAALRSWQQGSGQQKDRIELRLFSLAMERKARSGWQMQNYVQRFSEMKNESVQALHEVLTERRSVLEFFEHLTLEEQRELKRLLPEYFPEDSKPDQALTTMSRQRWSALKKQLQELTEEDSVQTNPVPGERSRIPFLEYQEIQQFLNSESPELFFNFSQMVQKMYEAASQAETGLSEKMKSVIGKAPLLSLIKENQEMAAFLTECFYEIPELKVYCIGTEAEDTDRAREPLKTVSEAALKMESEESFQNTAERISETVSAEWKSINENQEAKQLISEVVRKLYEAASQAEQMQLEPIQPATQVLSEKGNKGNQFREIYTARKKEYMSQLQRQEAHLPEEMEAVIGKAPLISLIKENKETAAFLREYFYEIPELEIYRIGMGEAEPAGNRESWEPSETAAQEAALTEIIESLDAKEWDLLESRILQKTAEKTELEMLFREALKTVSEAALKMESEELFQNTAERVSETVSAEWKSMNENQKAKQLISEVVRKLYEAARQAEQIQLEQMQPAMQILSEKRNKGNQFREIYTARKKEYMSQLQRQEVRLPEEMEAVIGKAPLISLIKENKETAAFLRECFYEIPELEIYRIGMGEAEPAGNRESWESSETAAQEAALTEIIESLDSREWNLLESRILQKTEETAVSETLFQGLLKTMSEAAFLTECFYEIPELKLYQTNLEEANAAGDKEALETETRKAPLTGTIETLDSKEWKLLENRILKKAEAKIQTTFEQQKVLETNRVSVTAAEYVFLKTIREHIEENSVFSTVSGQRRTGQKEAGQFAVQYRKIVKAVSGTAEETVRKLAAEAAVMETVRNRAVTENVRVRAMMADSAITQKNGGRIREFFKEQTKTELCSYEFVMPDRIVVRPAPVRGTEPPQAAGQGNIIHEISPEETRRIQTDILKIQRPEQQRLKGEYEQKLEELSDRLNEQKEALERLQETQHQLSDSSQTRQMINRMMKQLKRQLQLERLQRGTD